MGQAYLDIKELDMDLIHPSPRYDESEGGSKIVVIGRPGTGKSNLIMNLVQAKNDYIPCTVVFSETEVATRFYGNHFPSMFIYNELDDRVIENIVTRQTKVVTQMPPGQNRWMGLIMDDCMADPKLLDKPLYSGLYKNGRHMKMFFILALQYALDLRPAMRNSIDGVFLLNEDNAETRVKLFRNFGGNIPSIKVFNTLMNALTNNYGALYIHNRNRTGYWRDSVYWFQPKLISKEWKAGSKGYWRHAEDRTKQEFM